MEFGIAIATSADSWKIALRAEELGFARAWFYDTQMLSADPFVAAVACAVPPADGVLFVVDGGGYHMHTVLNIVKEYGIYVAIIIVFAACFIIYVKQK